MLEKLKEKLSPKYIKVFSFEKGKYIRIAPDDVELGDIILDDGDFMLEQVRIVNKMKPNGDFESITLHQALKEIKEFENTHQVTLFPHQIDRYFNPDGTFDEEKFDDDWAINSHDTAAKRFIDLVNRYGSEIGIDK